MSQTGDSIPHRTGTQRKVKLPTGRLATVELTDDPDYVAKLTVTLGERQWVFGVRQDLRAEYLASYENDRKTKLDCPDWLNYIAEKTGLEGFEA